MRYGDALPASFRYIPFWAKSEFKSNPFKAVDIVEGDKVIDVGAHVGMFSVAALEQGAAYVRAFEPEPKNYDRLTENLASFGGHADAVNAAVIPAVSQAGAVLVISSLDGAHQLQGVVTAVGKSDKARRTVMVQTRSLRNELHEVEPTVLKVDIEGAEYDLFDSLDAGDLGSLRTIFIEFHPYPDRDLRVHRIRELLLASNFYIVSDHLRAFVATRTPGQGELQI